MLIFQGVSYEDPCFLLRCKNLSLQTQQQAKKHIGVRMLAKLKKHGTMHVPQVGFTGWVPANSLGMVMLLPKQDVFHAQAGSTQIYNI